MTNDENKGPESPGSNTDSKGNDRDNNTTGALKTFYVRPNILKEICDYTGISVDIPKLESVLNEPSIDWLHDGTFGIILRILEILGIPIEEQFENMSETHFSVEFTQFIAEIQDHVKNNQIERIKIEIPPAQLDPNSWFEKIGNAKKFSPHLCAKDYLRVYPHVITEYVSGDSTPSQFVGDHWLKDANGIIRSKLEEAGKIAPGQIRASVESICNITRIVDPDKIELPLDSVMPLPAHTIPIKTGLFNLLDRNTIPHTPNYFYTEAIPRKYIPGAKPEVFLKFLNYVFHGDPGAELKKSQIFETIAWTLIKNYDIQGSVIFYGQGGEGKSIIHGVMADLLVWTTSISLKELESDKFKRAELYGKWANLISESTTEIITSEYFKRFTDGTAMIVDRKNCQPFHMISHAKMIIDTNELPVKEIELRAFYRRIIAIIDFPNKLEDILTPEEISDFVEKLKNPDELDAIFSYVVDNYYANLVKSMKFTGHLNPKDAEQKWEERSNPASAYIKMKESVGQILTDIEKVKMILAGDEEALMHYITKEKNTSEEYLTTVKQDVITEAVKWASEKGFPAKNINSGSLGRAIVSLGYPNLTINKKIRKTIPVKAWKDIAIITSSGRVAVSKNDPLPPKSQSLTGLDMLSSGSVFLGGDVAGKNKKGEKEGVEMPPLLKWTFLSPTQEKMQYRVDLTEPLLEDSESSQEPEKSNNSDAKKQEVQKYYQYKVLETFFMNGKTYTAGFRFQLDVYLSEEIKNGLIKCLNCEQQTEKTPESKDITQNQDSQNPAKPIKYKLHYYRVLSNFDRYADDDFLRGSDIRLESSMPIYKKGTSEIIVNY